jgi:hypothetical protein
MIIKNTNYPIIGFFPLPVGLILATEISGESGGSFKYHEVNPHFK